MNTEYDLVLEKDPRLWIRANQTRLPSVKSLKLDYEGSLGKGVIGDSIGDFTQLTCLSIRYVISITYLPNNILSLSNLRELNLQRCYNLQELPLNLGDLKSLTQITLYFCGSIKSLPNSLAKLSKLTTLNIYECLNLQDLPANLGELKSLTHFMLSSCSSIKSLPSSVAKLGKLTTLKITSCGNLQELPANLGELKSLTHFMLCDCSSIKSLPSSFAKHCESLKECPSDLNVVDLSLNGCCSILSLPRGLSNLNRLFLPHREEERLANLNYFVSLRYLQFTDCSLHKPKELPANVDKLPQLSVLDIQHTNIKCLPSSITMLPQLRLLLLPKHFILETLPSDLKESLVITVKNTHVRKTWKELKKEMDISSSTFTVDPPEYLRLTEDPRQWILDNYDSHSKVRILDLELCGDPAKDLTASISKLAELTHLYISGGTLSQLPLTFTRITHISLYSCRFECDMESFFNSLGKLSTLKSFHLHCSYKLDLPEHMALPLSLRHLTLDRLYTHIPQGLATLSNLKALHLSNLRNIDSFPENLNPEKLKLVDCNLTNIKSLPRGLRQVEILHTIMNLCSGNCNSFAICLNQLVAAETLSLTCHRISSFPSVAGLLKLQELQLKDCFRIKELPANLEVTENLCFLNVSGTGIKSLPYSIWNLPNLQCLILPKWFLRENVPLKFRNKGTFFDDTDDQYYKDMGYHDFDHETNIKGVKEVVSKESEKGIISQQQISPQGLLNQPHATSVLGDSHDSQRNYPIGQNSHHTICNYQNPESRECTANNRLLNLQKSCIPSSQHALQPEQMASMTLEIDDGLPPIQHDFSRVTANNLPVSENGQNEDYLHTEGDYAEGRQNRKEITREAIENFFPKNITLVSSEAVDLEDYNFDGRDNTPINENSQLSVYHSHDQEETFHFGESSQHGLQYVQLLENTTWVNEDVSNESEEVIIAEQQTSPLNFISNGRNDLIGDNSHHTVSHSQEMDVLSSGACDQMFTELSSNLQGTISFGKNSQHAVQDRQMDITNSATLQEDISSSDKRDDSCSGNNLDALENKQIDKNSHSKGENRKRYKKIDFTREDIQRLIAKRMKLVDAAKELSASRSTLKRKLKEYGVRWPKSSNKRRNTELPSSSKISSQVNLVPVGNEYTMEGLDGGNQHILPNPGGHDHGLNHPHGANQHTLPDHLPSGNVISNSTPVATQRYRYNHQRVEEQLSGANVDTLPTIVQPNECPRTFVVKATYKDDLVKVSFSLSHGIDLLKEVIGKKLNLEVDKFKLKYQDEDKDWVLVACISDLKDALRVSESSGSNVIRLSIISVT